MQSREDEVRLYELSLKSSVTGVLIERGKPGTETHRGTAT